jgi:hypothetical protein
MATVSAKTGAPDDSVIADKNAGIRPDIFGFMLCSFRVARVFNGNIETATSLAFRFLRMIRRMFELRVCRPPPGKADSAKKAARPFRVARGEAKSGLNPDSEVGN